MRRAKNLCIPTWIPKAWFLRGLKDISGITSIFLIV